MQKNVTHKIISQGDLFSVSGKYIRNIEEILKNIRAIEQNETNADDHFDICILPGFKIYVPQKLEIFTAF